MRKWWTVGMALVVTAGLAGPVHANAPTQQPTVPGVTPEMQAATQGIVSASHPLAAEAGRNVLAKGGNAVDAAVAVQMALNVVEPMMSGMGGGGFMMIYQKQENKVSVIDSREMAPAAADPKMFLDANGKPIEFYKRHTSGQAVGVPGTLKGLEVALHKYGTLPWTDVLAPAIQYARNGVPVNWATAMYIGQNVEKLKQYETAAAVFAPNGVALKQGETLKQPDLAKTLEQIGAEGVTQAFYEGPIGAAMVAEVQKRGGKMTLDDLKSYTVHERQPVRGTYRGYEIVSMSPPSSGGLTLLEILKLMEGYNVQKMGINSVDTLHRFLEASHLAFADRAKYMADEAFHAVPKLGLLDDQYIKQRRELINPHVASPNVTAGDPWKFEQKPNQSVAVAQPEKPIGQTTHFSVIDKWGNMVSYTTTIEQVFGAGIMVPGYGFMLNNEMTDFDAVPGGVNEVAPKKRPLSSMSPTLVLKDGKPFLALGSPGGPTIITSVAQTLMNVIDHNLPLQEAILTPLVYSSSYPTVRWEPGIAQDTLLQLVAKGHQFEDGAKYIGNIQALIIDAQTGKMYGGADNTREGTVIGVDNVHYNAPQMPAIPTEQRPFTVTMNKGVVPFTAAQELLHVNRAWVEQAKIQLAFGLTEEESSALHPDRLELNGKVYLPVRKVAEAKGWNVAWDAEKSHVVLTKDVKAPTGSNYYSEDVFKITN